MTNGRTDIWMDRREGENSGLDVIVRENTIKEMINTEYRLALVSA